MGGEEDGESMVGIVKVWIKVVSVCFGIICRVS